MSETTLHEHLKAARAARDIDKMREHAARIAKLPRKHKPCNCGTIEGGKHKRSCPGYDRERWHNRKTK